MPFRNLKTATDVSAWRLCCGCGACVSACTRGALEMIDIENIGLRPFADKNKCQECSECIAVCPGVSIKHSDFKSDKTFIPELRKAWGPVIEVWEGYASDENIRYKGSSGGIATALGLFCIEILGMSGILQVRGNPDQPWKNMTVYNHKKDDILSSSGSRYSPSSICEKFNWIKESQSLSAVIGRPCDIIALRKSQNVDQELENKTGLAVSIFCAGTPSTMGTKNLLKSLNAEIDDLNELRYRGHGWPGMATAVMKETGMKQMTYSESWGKILTPCVQYACRICPDHTGEFADISCGDPWYREIEPGDPGRSLILVRTARGKEILEKAVQTGYIILTKGDPGIVNASQESLLRNRRHLFGRLMALKLMSLPTPKYRGFSLYSNFRDLSVKEKLRSILGTIRRVIMRGMFRPEKFDSQNFTIN